jgi:hypothetical protein
LVAWHSGHRVRLPGSNPARVWGFYVFIGTLQCCCQKHNMHCHCVEINASKKERLHMYCQQHTLYKVPIGARDPQTPVLISPLGANLSPGMKLTPGVKLTPWGKDHLNGSPLFWKVVCSTLGVNERVNIYPYGVKVHP